MIGLASALGIGALFGLKHATDADHVVAVTAIVARERSVARAARVGVLWGIGHSLTVFLLGGTIIAFRLVVPPRVGLGLEFGVAILVLTTIAETAWALAYLLVFGLGTVLGMLGVTVLVAVPAMLAANRIARLHGGIRMAAGALSVVFGVLLARELIVEGGLFSAAPAWDPR